MTISNAQLIYDRLQEVYPHSMQSITQLSFNDSGNRNFIESDICAFDYDVVNNEHPSCTQKEKSPDALFLHDGIFYFVEFKEGSSDKSDIRAKIHEGCTTIFAFCKKYLQTITREDVFAIDIRYAVIIRQKGSQHRLSFARVMELCEKTYSLKNIEGFVVNRTRVLAHPKGVYNFLNNITSGEVTELVIHNHLGTERLRVPQI